MVTPVQPESDNPRPRHPWLYALPDCRLPQRVACAGGQYELVETFKHDFFAATGLYRGPAGLTVLKLGRVNDFLGLPMSWAGRFLARREIRMYELLQDLAGVPALIGSVGSAGFMHAYVRGHPLGRREAVGDEFFGQLIALLKALHERHIAYVDLNKRQNVLMGDDGRPYLIDFQISLHLPPAGGLGGWLRRWLLGRFQSADRYHCLKHKRRLRPEQLSEDERVVVERLSVWIRVHRVVSRPLTHMRRWLLRRLQSKDDAPVAGSSAK